MDRLKQNVRRKVLLLGITAFLAMSILGLAHFSMAMNADGQMSNCPFMGVTTIVCNMSPLEHLAAWQSMFTALPLKNISVLAVLLLAVVFAVFSFRNFWRSNSLKLLSFHNQRFRNPTFIIQNELQKAFSQGILHSKLF